jgi:hypothetical protein
MSALALVILKMHIKRDMLIIDVICLNIAPPNIEWSNIEQGIIQYMALNRSGKRI